MAQQSTQRSGKSNGRRGSMSSLGEKASDYMEDATEYFSNFDKNPGNFIRNHPLQAAIGGAVAGFLVGMALRRRAVTE